MVVLRIQVIDVTAIHLYFGQETYSSTGRLFPTQLFCYTGLLLLRFLQVRTALTNISHEIDETTICKGNALFLHSIPLPINQSGTPAKLLLTRYSDIQNRSQRSSPLPGRQCIALDLVVVQTHSQAPIPKRLRWYAHGILPFALAL